MKIHTGKAIKYIGLRPSRFFYSFLGIVTAAFFLRFWGLGAQDFWYDEVYTIRISKFFFAHNHLPHSYYSFMNLWIRWFGTSEISLRFPSALMSGLTVILAGLAGRRFLSGSSGLYAALFMALSPFQIWYAQEARPYSLVALLAVGTTYFLFEAALSPERKKWWAYYGLFSIFGIYAQAYYLIFFIFQLIAFFIFLAPKFKIRNIHWLCLFIFLCILWPRFRFMAGEWSYYAQGFWAPRPIPTSLLVTMENFLAGYGLTIPVYRLALLPIFIAMLFSIRSCLRDTVQAPYLKFLWFLLLSCLLFLYLFSKIGVSFYADRGLITISSFFCLILGSGAAYLSSARSRRILLAGLFSFQILGVSAYFRQEMPTTQREHHIGVYLKKSYKPAVGYICGRLQENDVVAFTIRAPMPSFAYYGNAELRTRMKLFFAPGALNDDWYRPFVETFRDKPLNKILELPYKRFWLVACDFERSGDLKNHPNSWRVKEFMKLHFKRVLEEEFDGLHITLYERS